MKQLLVFIRKEFYHVFRDRRTLLIMFGLPVVQIVLFGFALSSEVKNIRLVIADYAKDQESRELIQKVMTSEYLIVEQVQADYEQLADEFKKGEVKGALIIPANFGANWVHLNQATLQLITDGSDPNISKTIVQYLTAIITDFQQQRTSASGSQLPIQTQIRMLYNEEQNGSLNFIPGVMALILMIVCTALTSVSIVKEKEMGTMEVLLVSPFKPVWVLIAKAIPYLILSLVNFTLILVLSITVLDIQIRGSILLLYFESTLFIITCLSLGLLISNVTHSQQTALLISLMGMMLPTLIFTGFLMPLENMPKVFQLIAHVIPSRWYYIIIKSVMLKGMGLPYVWKETLVLIAMSSVLLIVALKNFKIRL